MPVERRSLPPAASHDVLDPVGVWNGLTADVGLLTDVDRACLLSAQRHADMTWATGAQGHLDLDAMRLGVRDQGWHHLAVAAYHLMRASSAYAHLAGFQPAVCGASTDLDVWLLQPSGRLGVVGTVADALVGGQDGRYDNAGPVQCLAELVAAAQSVGLFGVPDYYIGLATGLSDGASQVRVTLDSTYGATLASGLLPIGQLVDPSLYGVDAAQTALGNIALVVDTVLRQHAGATWLGPSPSPNSVRAWTATADAMPELALPTTPVRPPTSSAISGGDSGVPQRVSAANRAFAPLDEIAANLTAPNPSPPPDSQSGPHHHR